MTTANDVAKREAAIEWIESKGYSQTNRCGNWSHASYVKDFVDELTEKSVTLHCTISFIARNCVLVGYPNNTMFELSTGRFSIGHARFDDLFESRIVDMLFRLEGDIE